VLLEEISKSFRAMKRRRVLLALEFLINNEAGKDGISGHTINSHEASSNNVSKDEDAKSGDEG